MLQIPPFTPLVLSFIHPEAENKIIDTNYSLTKYNKEIAVLSICIYINMSFTTAQQKCWNLESAWKVIEFDPGKIELTLK